MSDWRPSAKPVGIECGWEPFVNAHISHYYLIGMFSALLCWTTSTRNGLRTTPKYNPHGVPMPVVESFSRHRASSVERRVIFRAREGIDYNACLLQ
eukprot:1659808-Pyramimonas_sp.AAC.1